MDIRQLRHVSMLALSGSYVRAAEELHITQSALTRSIQNIERELGFKIFERGPRGAQPTQEGQMVISLAEQVNLIIGGLHHNVGLLKQGQLGKVKIGLGPAVASIYKAELLKKLINDYPTLHIDVYVNNADQLREDLLSERIDFFIAAHGQVANDQRIEVKILGDISVAFITRADHPLTKIKKVSASDLSAFPFITGTRPHQQDVKELIPMSALPEFKATIFSNDFSSLNEVVKNTDAIWMAPSLIVLKELRQGALVELKRVSTLQPYQIKLALMSLAMRNLSASAQLVIKTFLDIQKEIESVR